MGTDTAIQRGAQGERRIAQVLDDLRPELGYGLIHDLLIEFNGHTTQMDHVLVDRFGVLVVETKNYGAKLFGTSQDHDWTAVYGNGKSRAMFNPLRQNDIHRKWLGKLLVQHQRDLPERYIQSVIVFVRGEIDSLKLDDVDQMRVVTPEGLADYVRARYDFNPNEGQLGPEAQEDLYDFLYGKNQSGDQAVVARHIEMARDAKNGRKKQRWSRHRPRQWSASSPHRGRWTAPGPTSRPRNRQEAAPAGLGWLVMFAILGLLGLAGLIARIATIVAGLLLGVR